jgi:hypothetical protein
MFVRGAGLAIRALVLVCAVTGEACLLPQSVDPIATVPHPPPHFVLESIRKEELAPLLQLYAQGSTDITANCFCQLELAVPFVEEDDPTVVLEARWFIDYDPAVPNTVRPWVTQTLDQGFNNPSTIRPLNPFEFSAGLGFTPPSGYHLVEIVIGEKAGFDTSATAERPNQSMIEGYSADIFRFPVFVTTTPDPARPSCSQEPYPSVRVCQ